MASRSFAAGITTNIGAARAGLESPRPLRCLLLSPIPPLDAENGDTHYTLDLLAQPPAGVEYVPYSEALASGELAPGPSLRRGRGRFSSAAAGHAALTLARRASLLLPDPVRWFRVTGRFDLIHVHCFPVRFLGPTPPVVISDSAGTWWHWTAGKGLPERRVHALLRRERRLARSLRYLHPSAYPDRADGLVLFVDAGRPLLSRIGADASVARRSPPGVPRARRRAEGDGRTVLFVARDFGLKGGDTALEVIQRLRRRRPELRLLVAGPDGRDPGIDNVVWLGRLDRDRLYEEVYPVADVLLHPTRVDCAPLVVQEALAHGLPIVAPDAFALPELVRDGVTGLLFPPGDVDAAAGAVERLLADSELRLAMGAAAVDDFEARFSIEVRNETLAAAYREAVR